MRLNIVKRVSKSIGATLLLEETYCDEPFVIDCWLPSMYAFSIWALSQLWAYWIAVSRVVGWKELTCARGPLILALNPLSKRSRASSSVIFGIWSLITLNSFMYSETLLSPCINVAILSLATLMLFLGLNSRNTSSQNLVQLSELIPCCSIVVHQISASPRKRACVYAKRLAVDFPATWFYLSMEHNQLSPAWGDLSPWYVSGACQRSCILCVSLFCSCLWASKNWPIKLARLATGSWGCPNASSWIVLHQLPVVVYLVLRIEDATQAKIKRI